MLKLDDAGVYMEFRKSLASKTKAKALQALKQHCLLKKMQNSLLRRNLMRL